PFDQLEREHGNLRAALDTLAAAGAAEGGLRLCATLSAFWGARGTAPKASHGWSRCWLCPARSAARPAPRPCKLPGA
ncbi:MAG: hypothetical protein ACRDJN_20240, partial [Chloroflexota bacterium]